MERCRSDFPPFLPSHHHCLTSPHATMPSFFFLPSKAEEGRNYMQIYNQAIYVLPFLGRYTEE